MLLLLSRGRAVCFYLDQGLVLDGDGNEARRAVARGRVERGAQIVRERDSRGVRHEGEEANGWGDLLFFGVAADGNDVIEQFAATPLLPMAAEGEETSLLSTSHAPPALTSP